MMIGITFVAALLFTVGFSQSQKSEKDGIQLWAAGFMHEDEVIGGTRQKWFALYRHETGFELRATRVDVIDSSDGLHNRFVKVDNQLEVMFLVCGIANLTEGSVKTVFSGNQYIKPGQYISLQLSNDLRSSYQLYAEGKEDKETVDNYKIMLYGDQRRQTILERAKMYLEGVPNLLWAGDLDRDGKLDLLMDMTNHYNATEPTLFLSSRAAPNEFVKNVASHRRIGC